MFAPRLRPLRVSWPALSLFQSLKIRRSVNFMLFRNVVRRFEAPNLRKGRSGTFSLFICPPPDRHFFFFLFYNLLSRSMGDFLFILPVLFISFLMYCFISGLLIIHQLSIITWSTYLLDEDVWKVTQILLDWLSRKLFPEISLPITGFYYNFFTFEPRLFPIGALSTPPFRLKW